VKNRILTSIKGQSHDNRWRGLSIFVTICQFTEGQLSEVFKEGPPDAAEWRMIRDYSDNGAEGLNSLTINAAFCHSKTQKRVWVLSLMEDFRLEVDRLALECPRLRDRAVLYRPFSSVSWVASWGFLR
jgi:hypothetical protein